MDVKTVPEEMHGAAILMLKEVPLFDRRVSTWDEVAVAQTLRISGKRRPRPNTATLNTLRSGDVEICCDQLYADSTMHTIRGPV